MTTGITPVSSSEKLIKKLGEIYDSNLKKIGAHDIWFSSKTSATNAFDMISADPNFIEKAIKSRRHKKWAEFI